MKFFIPERWRPSNWWPLSRRAQLMYMVTGPGRTGSLWTRQIIRYLPSTGLSDYYHTLHTHHPFEHPHFKKAHVILVKRKNLFESVISHLVAKHTNEYFFYTNKTFKPIWIPEYNVIEEANGKINWFERFNTEKHTLNSYTCICYEDLVANVPYVEKYVADQLGIPRDSRIDDGSYDHHKNPRDYRNLVQNYDWIKQFCQDQQERLDLILKDL